MIKTGFSRADILIPQKNLEKWCVVACDQYTSQPEYWDEVKKTYKILTAHFLLLFLRYTFKTATWTSV